jgi:hypothetical protein
MEKINHGKKINDNKITAYAQIPGAETQPVPDMRAATRLYPKIRHMPYLFQASGSRSPASRGEEIQLVKLMILW